ncbi:dihydrolipoyl dehydrogenase family protein [Georgenia ruanii]|uniref:Pyridine nucleotide-disulfide oxidoreductase n=1 Tax=Georgenia ruanii TaxID=348442 RepID=A0A7J9UWR6_9MICO|nr:NAD(P)/FAD-dependent oxidoreductase [Georgenia ruanii]MPV89058.1 pyridine nucleotide-disulfide oxidoreductase [Georgenia ruanii]
MSEEAADQTVDVVVIGGGAVGEVAAGYTHQGGLSVALVEQSLLGGECSYYACMPSKALLRPGQAVAAARGVEGAGPAVTGPLDAAGVLARRTTFTHDWDDSSQVRWAVGEGLEVVRGTARLVGEREVVVAGADGEERRLGARHAVVLATGSMPSTPPIPGLDRTRHWTTRDATSSHEVPPRLVVIGAGVAGCELALAYVRLGSAVTVVARSQVLPMYPFRAGGMVARGLSLAGADVRTQVETTSIERPEGPDEPAVIRLSDGHTMVAEEVLVATGRRPHTRGLGLETVGLEVPDGKPLEVDDSGRVTALADGWLYAVGDVTGRAPLTHQGKYAARVVGDAIAARAAGKAAEPRPWSAYAATADHAAVPQVVFTDPELAQVGLTEQQARERGHRVRTAEVDLYEVAGASILADHYTGWAQLVIDDERDVVLGAIFVGQDVAELLHAATIAVVGEVPLDRLWHAVPAYPTLSEAWLKLLEADRARTA